MKNKTIDNRYKILKKIGSGGFAIVYKSWATNLERYVAVKKIMEEYSKDAKFLDMFRNEAINTAKLDHQNIVRVIDFLRTSQNIYYIIMEYVRGRDLKYLMQKCRATNTRIPFGLSLYIMCETLKALDYAYNLTDEIDRKKLLIVHRDVSPGNIMLYFDGRVKLTDFGIAKVSTKFGEKNKEGVLRGKVSYMSPEQAEGNVAVDNRSDIFSIGIIFYEMLTGKRLYDGKSDHDIWNMAKKAKIDFSIINKSTFIPNKIKEILKKALVKDRDKRYQSTRDMIRDIEIFLNDSYQVQAEGLKDFIARCLTDEIFQEDKEQLNRDQLMQHTEEKIRREPEKPPAQPEEKIEPELKEKKPESEKESREQAPLPKSPEEAKSSAPLVGEKTVFDFVLDTAKRHEKIILYSLLSCSILAVLFAGLDIYKQITPFGSKLHGRLWPPALTIDSFPHGATASLMHKDKDVLDDKSSQTPIHIDKILPGNYTLILHKDGYRDIERRIRVTGKDTIYSSGSVYNDNVKKNYFLFPFEVKLIITSKPSGAAVYLDGKKLPGTTPLQQNVDVGKHAVKIYLDGFEPLGSTEMTARYGQCWIDLSELNGKQKNIDHRYWSFNKRTKAGINEYILAGSFWKSIHIKTRPSFCEVYINDEKEPYGTTPLKNVHLKFGKHRLRITKKGFKSIEKDINVNAEIKSELIYSLKKYVWFRSISSKNPGKDLKALVTIKGTSVKNKKTPFRISLPMKTFKTTFTKEPRFESVTKTLNVKNSSTLKAQLHLRAPYIRVKVIDEIDNQPVSNAYILIDNTYQGSTGETGVWEGYAKEGKFTAKINTGDRYPEKIFELDLKAGERHTETIMLNKPSECTLDIDTRPHFIGAQIYVDGEYITETLRKIKKLSRGKHTILIRHYDLEYDIETEIIFSNPKQTIKVRLDEKADFIIKQ